MSVVTDPPGIPVRLTCAIAIGCLSGTRIALAFPASDPANPSVVTNRPGAHPVRPPQPASDALRLRRRRGGRGMDFCAGDKPGGDLDRQRTEHHEQPPLGLSHHRHPQHLPSPATLPTPRSSCNTDRNSAWLPGRRKRTASPTSCSASGCSQSCRTSSTSTQERSPAAHRWAAASVHWVQALLRTLAASGPSLAHSAPRGSPTRTRCRPTALRSRPIGCIASVTPERPRSAINSAKQAFPRETAMSRCSFRPATIPHTTSPTRAWRSSRPATALRRSGTSRWRMHNWATAISKAIRHSTP